MPEEISLTIKLIATGKHKHRHVVDTIDYVRNKLQSEKYILSQLDVVQSGEVEVIYSEKM